ncbi:hypothetical protein EDB87DRAFT_1526748, partial [Lactarius vividus]
FFVTATFKALSTAQDLHKSYSQAKKMTKEQITVFIIAISIAGHKWDYRLFGFTSALLETLPFVESIFSVFDRVGAAMRTHINDTQMTRHWI